ncbi:MAG: ATP-binding protein [Lachnospiraceae bacterium]|nr:ATP-binding protein [Lachnospiraceae bacterium]
MTKKIFRSIFFVASASLIACFIIIMGVLYDYFGSIQEKQLEAQTTLAARGVENEGYSYLEGIKMNNYRITWVGADGEVLYDTKSDAKEMENHLDREEIIEAMETGSGESSRYSSTIAEKTIYFAKLLPDGTVIRLSTTQYTVVALALGMLQPIFFVMMVAIILSAVLANRLSKRVIDPLNSLDLDNPLENDAYEELSPLLTRIEQQRRQIKRQIGRLTQMQNEFSAVTENMSEGLILLGEKGNILSINPAAAKLFETSTDCIGHDILTVDRSLIMQELTRTAQDGKFAEATMELAGREYQINVSPVISNGKMTGSCILAFDITEKEQAEKLRREFSANVSHELKTPLHSIMGSAELIENGLVKQEDMQRFVGRIRTEAGRLVMLIDDIIRLSQLDEGNNITKEDVNLKTLADEALSVLSTEAAARKIKLSLEGDDVYVWGVRRMLYEIIYNLCDNAVKYNVENGKVDVSLLNEADGVILTVSDTGIGIPKEQQSRVFERFYRVDKSHSRETGGTGLGLSIVKHAAKYHDADITLESEAGKGTKISIKFPKQYR